MRRRLNEADRRRKTISDGNLAALSSHPSWPDLEAKAADQIANLEHRILVAALQPGGLDQREIDLLRGTVAGMRWLLNVPRNAERSLERYLRDQGERLTMTGGE